MKQYVFPEPSEFSFEKVGIKGKIFPTAETVSRTEFVLIQTEAGHETVIIEHECDFIYYILEGEGYFVIEKKKQLCSQGDLVVIPAGTEFTYKGKLKMLLNVTPPYWPEQEEVVNNDGSH